MARHRLRARYRPDTAAWTSWRLPKFSPAQQPLTSVGVIGYIIIGGLAGWVGSKIVKGKGYGILMDIVIGVVGALIGGYLLSFAFQTETWGWILTFFTALLGSVILLWLLGLVRRA